MIDNQYDLCYSKAFISRAAQVQTILKDIIKGVVVIKKTNPGAETKYISDSKNLTPTTFDEDEDIDFFMPRIDVYQNEPYLKWQRITQL
jgi:hypothetical protein